MFASTAPERHAALVVGVSEELPVHTDRDHRIKVQLPWQRDTRPLAGGLAHPELATGDSGNAPGNEASGTWVRLSLPQAGPNWGAVFIPRVGSEVQIDYIEGDIDRPLALGRTHNGEDRPPFPAGVAAGTDHPANHPGVLSGWHSAALDGQGCNQWTVDDATGQLRTRLLATASQTAASELALGHLIQQAAAPVNASAHRGPWRGAGWELHTQGWASLRAGAGLLVSTSAREGSYGSAASTQMDAAEAVAQLKAAQQLGQAPGRSAQAQRALDLPAHADALPELIRGLDSIERPATPTIVLDTPATLLAATEAGLAHFSGQDTAFVAQGDWHEAAAHTAGHVSGQATSLYTHAGGLKAIAANGPVSLRAHTDRLELLAEREITVISVGAEIHARAKDSIVLTGGQSRVTLQGSNITFACPGKFSVKAAAHGFEGGASGAPELPSLPNGLQQITHWVELDYRDPVSGEGLGEAGYEVHFVGAPMVSGTLDATGQARHDNVAGRPVRQIVYKPRPPQADDPHDPLDKLLA